MEISMGCVLVPPGCLLVKADLVPKSNILIDSNGRACLAGFDLFAIIPDERPTTPPDTPRWVGNVPWSAPEVLNGGVPSNRADIFSLAMVAIEARHG